MTRARRDSWNPVKELKEVVVVCTTSTSPPVESGEGIERPAPPSSTPAPPVIVWNPVKELKDCEPLAHFLLNTSFSGMWNPVKELKGIVFSMSSAAARVSVESGEGIESRRSPLSKAPRGPRCGIR